MPLDKDRFNQQLAQLESYIQDLQKLKYLPRDEFTLKSDTEALAERRIYKAVQAALDIAISINTAHGLGVPKMYREVVDHLTSAQIISPDLATKFANMIGMRNILAHEYATINPQEIYNVIQTHYQDLIDLAKNFSRYIESH